MRSAPSKGGIHKARPRRQRGRPARRRPSRNIDYHSLRNPFAPVEIYSSDRIAAIHNAALDLLENLGMKVLLNEARTLFRAGGAVVDDDTGLVRIGREIVDAAIGEAPRSIHMVAGAPDKDVTLELGVLTMLAGAGSAYATDLQRGRRASSLADFRELVRITDHFDALQMLDALVEPQDVPTQFRHYSAMESQLELSNKIPFIYSRGSRQAVESFEMLQLHRGVSDAAFAANPHVYTIINTNSPRLLDIPMAQGLIDFARHRQLSIVTPFCLMGAMAPVTVAGALTLSHAEALAGIALTQLAQPGAPVCYGSFISNVDLKSGAPAFGTPEQVRANLASGQLARLIGLPWRCAAGSSANVNDAQAANETQMGMWSCLLAGSTIVLHAAGWIEGGLTVSYEKFITDMEVVHMFADLCQARGGDEDDLALDALQEVNPGGHFFGCEHTMQRYQTAFYPPLVADWSTFGTWNARGRKDASERATEMWKRIVRDHEPPPANANRMEKLRQYIAKHKAAGGAPPVS
ncbi:MAG: trimethylamine methyltransferase family protein [Rhodobacteraceae bacterium]|nr:trimethylamine methyltransferase family protein [Paracoccaceae bacterium]